MLSKEKQYISKENLIAYTQALNTKQEAQKLVLFGELESVKDISRQLQLELSKLDRNTLKSVGNDQKLTGNLIIAKDDLTNAKGNLVIEGNLEVKGSTITKDTETVLVQDNFIIINSDGEELGSQLSGIGIKTNTNEAYGIVYDAEQKSVSLGKGVIANGDFAFNTDESKPILTRDKSEELHDGHLLIWDAERKIAVDGGAYDLETLAKTFTTWEAYLALSKKLDTESSSRIDGDAAVAQLVDATKQDLHSEIESVAQRVTNIEDTDSMVQDMYDSVDAIKDQIVKGTYSADKLWGLSFNVITDPEGNIVGYEPYFTPMDDGELN